MKNRFSLDPNFLMPVPENLPTIEELEWYQMNANMREVGEEEYQQIQHLAYLAVRDMDTNSLFL
jgi:hypothetical protein